MTVSRRLRFEILRRDGYTCRYCGARTPDATLTVDHVLPVTLGGDDDPRNLVTACAECNAGKSSIAPDAPIVADVDATAMLFAKAIERVAEQRRDDRAATHLAIARFNQAWITWRWGDDKVDIPRDTDWPGTIERFLGLGLDAGDLEHFVDVAMRSRAYGHHTWRYFCGCCWRELTTRQEAARQLIEDGDV